MKAKHVKTIDVPDPDTNQMIEVCVFKHENGGMFAIDSSYLEQVFEDDTGHIIIPDMFSNDLTFVQSLELIGV